MYRLRSTALISVTLALIGSAALAASARADVVINEVNCEGVDWVELVNTGSGPVDVGGWLLTDDPIDAVPPRTDHRYELPPELELDPTAPLVFEKGTGGFPFGISCGNDTIRLADTARAPVDSIAVPELDDEDDAWGRYPNGTGPWTETSPTKGGPNEPAEVGPDDDLAAWLFDPAQVVEIGLSIPPESRESLASAPKTYADAQFTLTTAGGVYGPLDVGVHLKGNVSFRYLDGKAAFKLKFDHSVPGQRFLGLEKLTLNNMVQDPSQIHEMLAYDVFRAAGIAAPRTGYAHVTVDGEDYGLYLNVETPDEVFLRRHFDSTRHLLEGGPGADATAPGSGRFEVDAGSESDLSDLDALIAAAAGDGAFGERMSPVADVGELTMMWAVERFIGHWDGYGGLTAPMPNNFYLHSDGNGVFRMLPWGADQTFDVHMPFVGGQGVLITGCLQDPGCKAEYQANVESLPALVAGLGLDEKAEATAALLLPWQFTDPRREYTLGRISEAVASTRRFIAERPADVSDPVLWGEPDVVPPETEVRRGPDGVLRPKRGTTRVTVRIRFAGSEDGSRFECRLDDAVEYSPCGGALFVQRVGHGRHRLRVRAIDPSGNADPTPAICTWRVRRR